MKYLVATTIAVVAGGSALAAAPKVDPPRIISRPAARGNYTPASRTKVDRIVIHKAEGENAAGWFANPRASASSQYDVHKDGKVYRSVADDDIAWHAGNWSMNQRSIGIEHGGFTARNDTTEAQYRASARLTAHLCAKFGIPVDRKHIIGHNEVPDPDSPGKFGGANNHTDPGKHWDWKKYLALVRSYMGAKPPAPAPTNEAKLEAITGNLSIPAGTRSTVTVAYRNVGDRVWEPSRTFLDTVANAASPFKAPVHARTARSQVGKFTFGLMVPAGTRPQTVLAKVALWDGGKMLPSSVVALKITTK